MRRLLACILCCSGLLLSAAEGADVTVEPSGIHQSIDVRLMDDTVRLLAESKGKARAQIISGIVDKPELFAPPVLYFLSKVLFDEGQKDEATFWFYAGQLRGRIDATICADESARAAIGALNQKFGTSINHYAFKDISKLTNTVERVLVWEEKTPCEYDRRWINLHGMNAINGDTNAPLSAPKEQWETIRKNTRDEYRSSFYQALAEFRKLKR